MARYEDVVPVPVKVAGSNYTDDTATKVATKKKVDAYVDAAKATPVTTAVTSTPAVTTVADNGYTGYINALLQQQAELKAQRDAQVNAAYKNAKNSLNQSRQASLKDGYVAYMKGLKNMPQISAVSGNGGYAQSLLAKQQLGYENNRAAIEQNYMNNLRELEANKAAGIISNQADYLDGAQNYISQLEDVQKKYATQAASTTNAVTGVKLGNRVMSADEYIDYLISVGYSPTAAAELFKEKGISY